MLARGLYKASRLSGGVINSRTQSTELDSLDKKKEEKYVDAIPSEGDFYLATVGGVPLNQVKERHVRIFVPARTSMQSGTFNTRSWRIEFDTQERWVNPLMGWCSSADPLSNMHLEFGSREQAEEYCTSHGWRYVVSEPQPAKVIPKSYGANFHWNKRVRVSTK